MLSSRSHEITHGKRCLMESVGLTPKRTPCMTIASVEVSETAMLECCLPHKEDANAGPSAVDDRSSDHTAREHPPRSFSVRKAITANVSSACPLIHGLAKIPHKGETGATDALTFLGPQQNKRHSIHRGTG
jgi:hypothetical protein